MYIEPNTTIHVLKNVPLDTTYDHTIFFDNAQQQHVYFFRKVKYTYSNQTYQRVKRGWIRVRQNANDLYDCNYVMFQNTSYGNKWFYAFIKSVEYINDSVAEIEFEIDAMQTWFFNYNLDQCFVLREHSATDRIGDNLVPEDVNTGEYVSGVEVGANWFTDWKIVIISTSKLVDSSGHPLPVSQAADGGFFGGVYGACNYYIFPADRSGVTSVKQILSSLGLFNNAQNVVAMFMCPKQMIPSDPDTIETAAQSIADQQVKLTPFTLPFNPKGETSVAGATFTPFGGYVPKNNKLYTYPYNYFICENNQGGSQEYKYEYFPNPNNIVFEGTADISVEPSVICMPFGYMQKQQSAGDLDARPEFALTIKNFPVCTWATNDLGAKLVQGGISLALLAATKGFSAGFGTVNYRQPMTPQQIPNYSLPELPAGGNLMVMPHKYTPPISNGETANVSARLNPIDALVAGAITKGVLNSHMNNHIGTSNTLYISGYFDFMFRQIFLDAPFAEIVDDYFTRFGYACNKIKVPNINARPHWSYVKTANCTLTGSIPCDDAKTICDIYNNGITFWKNGDEIGNYSLDNRPIIR